MLPGEDEVALVFVDAAEDEVVESAVVDVSEDMEVSRSVDEFGREDESSASRCCSGMEDLAGLTSLVTAFSKEDGSVVLASEFADVETIAEGLGLLTSF